MKSKFNKLLTDELKDVLRKSYEYCKESRSKNLPLDVVMYYLLEKYIQQSNGECETLKDYLNGFSNKGQMLNDLQGLLKKSSKLKSRVFPLLTYPDDIVMDESLEAAMSRSEVEGSLLPSSKQKSSDKEITASIFFLSALFEGECESIELLNSYGITVENYLSFLNKDVENFLGEAINKFFQNMTERRIDPAPEDNLSDIVSDPEKAAEEDDEFESAGMSESISARKADPNSKTPFLDEFAFDMTKAASQNKYDPVIGRDKEIDQLVEILSCRKKNNAILLGDAGIGKSSIIEALSMRIAEGNIPRVLKGKRILSLDLNAIVAGSKYRGDMEQRLESIIKEILKSNSSAPEDDVFGESEGKIILYIDEIHVLCGAGGSGSSDMSQILKPYLVRGEFQVIGCTTTEEHRKTIEKDAALNRRFQVINVLEPNVEETTDILLGLRQKYSEFHRVKYSDEIIRACSELASRYIYTRNSPDRAIDIMDRSGALAKLRAKYDTSKVEELEKSIEEAVSNKLKAVEEQEFELAATFRATEKSLTAELEKTKAEIKNKAISQDAWVDVTLDDVAAVISKASKVPVDDIVKSDLTKVKDMKTILAEKVIGQETAVNSVALSLQKAFLNLRDEKKPISSMLWIGPTGVGKTYLVKELCKSLYSSEKSLIRIDCGEYAERHAVAKLIGAPPGYVGYDDNPGLLNAVRERPFSILLFDEIEKMSEEISNKVLLSILDEGTVTLSNGSKVDFKNSIIIFTSNIGTKDLQLKGDGMGFAKLSEEEKKKSDEATIMKAVKKHFRPEFINRLSTITVFNELSKEDMVKIFDLELKKLTDRLGHKGFTVSVSDSVRDLIIAQTDTKYGARDLSRGIIKYVEDKICEKMIDIDDIESFSSKNISLDIDENSEVVVTFVKVNLTA